MMSRSRLVLLFIAAAAALGIALLTAHLRNTEPDAAVGANVLPALAAGLNEVDEVRIFTAGNTSLVTLKRDADKSRWQVLEREGYPADFGKLREFLLKLAELEVIEVKTASPENYPQIGLEDLKNENAAGKRVEFGGLSAPLALILGKSTSYGSQYVRIDGEAQSYLAKPQISVYNEPKVWLDRTLLDLPTERVQEVRVELPEGKANERRYTVTREVREQTDFTVPNLPRGLKLSYSGTANSTAGGLANLGFEDVRAAKPQESWDSGVARAEYRLFDGTLVIALGRKETVNNPDSDTESEKHYVRFEVTFDPAQHQRFLPKPEKPADTPKQAAAPAQDTPTSAVAQGPQIAADQTPPPAASDPAEVRAQAQKLNEQVRGWVFELPAYKYDTLFRPLSEITEKS